MNLELPSRLVTVSGIVARIEENGSDGPCQLVLLRTCRGKQYRLGPAQLVEKLQGYVESPVEVIGAIGRKSHGQRPIEVVGFRVLPGAEAVDKPRPRVC